MYVMTWWIEGPFRLEGEKESIMFACKMFFLTTKQSRVKLNLQVFDDVGNELDPYNFQPMPRRV